MMTSDEISKIVEEYAYDTDYCMVVGKLDGKVVAVYTVYQDDFGNVANEIQAVCFEIVRKYGTDVKFTVLYKYEDYGWDTVEEDFGIDNYFSTFMYEENISGD